MDFPGYDLGEEDKQQYRYMGADMFEEVEIFFPSPIDLSQKKTDEFPRLGIKAKATVKWLEGCADKWAGCPAKFANSRGFDVFDPTSLTNVPQLEAAE